MRGSRQRRDYGARGQSAMTPVIRAAVTPGSRMMPTMRLAIVGGPGIGKSTLVPSSATSTIAASASTLAIQCRAELPTSPLSRRPGDATKQRCLVRPANGSHLSTLVFRGAEPSCLSTAEGSSAPLIRASR
jgi:hypothetical protein